MDNAARRLGVLGAMLAVGNVAIIAAANGLGGPASLARQVQLLCNL